MNQDKFKLNTRTVKRLRLLLTMTQIEFAKAINVSPFTVISWENGLRLPKLKSIKKMLNIAKEHKIKVQVKDFIIG